MRPIRNGVKITIPSAILRFNDNFPALPMECWEFRVFSVGDPRIVTIVSREMGIV